MDWSDTILFRPKQSDEATGGAGSEADVQVFPVQGVTLLQAHANNHEETETALDSLRGFRAAGRRVVLCDTSCLIDDYRQVERQLGRALVEEGNAEVLISCGKSGREVAIGARDTGLDLSNVVVCDDARSACEVLSYRLTPGDTVLLLGVEDNTRARLILSLETRLSNAAKAA